MRVVIPWVALFALALWARVPEVPALLLAVAGAGAAVVTSRARGVRVGAGVVLTVTGVLLALIAQGQDRRLANEWPDYWSGREDELAGELGRRLDDLLDRSTAAAAEVAALDTAQPVHPRLDAIRDGAGLSALMRYDAQGALIAWSGRHLGRVPDDVQIGAVRYRFQELPLASYLYVTAPVAGGGVAVAASLLGSDAPGGAGRVAGDDFVTRFWRATGEGLRLADPSRVAAAGVYDYVWDGAPLFSVALDVPGGAVRRGEVRARAGAAVAVVVVIAWLLLAAGARGAGSGGWLAALSAPLLAALIPLDALVAGGPTDAGIVARTLAVVLGGAVAAVALIPRIDVGLPRVATRIAALLAVPGVVWLTTRTVDPGRLAGDAGGWLAWQLIPTVAVAVLVWIALRAGRDPAQGRPPELLGWMLSGVAAVALVLPWAWHVRVEARLDEATAEVARLGTAEDPALEAQLQTLAQAVDSLDALGAGDVDLLYRAWSGAGFAERGGAIWLTLWTPGAAPVDLRFGAVPTERPAVAERHLDQIRSEGGVRVRRVDEADAHYAVHVALASGRVVTGVVPPFGTGMRAGSFATLFAAPDRQRTSDGLELVPLLPGERDPQLDSIRWVNLPEGRQAEVELEIAGTRHHVHYLVPLASPMVRAARALLIGGFGLAVILLVWLAGRLAAGAGATGAAGGPVGALRSFRGRVTFALFAFFALSNLIFGSLAYRTIEGASLRAAEVIAERAVGDAVSTWNPDDPGAIAGVARAVGSDLVTFRGGELSDAAVDEFVELGLYPGWVPWAVHDALVRRESLVRLDVESLGGREVVVAYRRLPDGDVIAAPVPLRAGATAVRSDEVVALLSAAILAGALLSLGLALLVGRALTNPIATLRTASERVGAGNLRVRLDAGRDDEFGTVFEAFNRMVRRLRRARGELVRTTRRTQAIVDEAAAGVVALDIDGVVTLVNPRARQLLGLALEPGMRPSAATGGAGDFVRWLDGCIAARVDEATHEFGIDERRMRARARRISRGADPSGLVVLVEDVTDELRTERVLAWGEMARQVAHEVKNPLTPMKLSAQHLLRAWDDRRDDFDTILRRNVAAMLGEIDRLAAIATGFSRFGAPAAAGSGPTGPVELAPVVDDVLTLYSSGDSGVAFLNQLAPGLPPVEARTDEFKEVLVNLLENARVAVGDRGTVRIVAHRSDDGAHVIVEVHDDGIGIPESALPRIFEPHFSTRSSGTGLGLAIVHRLVGSWGGSVWAESEPGRGTVVRMKLPVAGGGRPSQDS